MLIGDVSRIIDFDPDDGEPSYSEPCSRCGTETRWTQNAWKGQAAFQCLNTACSLVLDPEEHAKPGTDS